MALNLTSIEEKEEPDVKQPGPPDASLNALETYRQNLDRAIQEKRTRCEKMAQELNITEAELRGLCLAAKMLK